MLLISILHDHVTAFLHRQVKIFCFSKKRIQRTNILRLSDTKAPSKVKRHLLTSYKVNDVTKRTPRDANVTGSLAGFCFAFCILTYAPIVFSSK